MKFVQETQREFNCMGYALNTFCWEDIYDIYDDDDNIDVDMCVNELLENFPYLHQVSYHVIETHMYNYSECYPVAFRVGNWKTLSDFHFMKMRKDGKWYQKCGGLNGIYRHEGSIFEPWGRRDNNAYDSKVVFFLCDRKH